MSRYLGLYHEFKPFLSPDFFDATLVPSTERNQRDLMNRKRQLGGKAYAERLKATNAS